METKVRQSERHRGVRADRETDEKTQSREHVERRGAKSDGRDRLQQRVRHRAGKRQDETWRET
jgi:hypothetical protein